MRYDEIVNDASMLTYVQKLVQNPNFLRLKDAFVSHTPKGDDKFDTSIAVCFGQSKGTCFVFNELEKISKTPPKETTKKPASGETADIDLQ